MHFSSSKSQSGPHGRARRWVDRLRNLRRIGDCEEDIGPAVVFLAGEGARYITGATLMIDGGQNYLG